MAYYTAYAGLRRGQTARDALFISAGFGLAALVVFETMYEFPSIWRIVGSFCVAIVLSVVWRKWLQKGWNTVMQRLGVHRDDGIHGAWDRLVDAVHLVGQISVHTTDGRILYLDDRRKYANAPFKGLYLGGDESIGMIVEREEFPDGTIEERKDIVHKDWGTRLTYLPASKISRVNIRLH